MSSLEPAKKYESMRLQSYILGHLVKGVNSCIEVIFIQTFVDLLVLQNKIRFVTKLDNHCDGNKNLMF